MTLSSHGHIKTTLTKDNKSVESAAVFNRSEVRIYLIQSSRDLVNLTWLWHSYTTEETFYWHTEILATVIKHRYTFVSSLFIYSCIQEARKSLVIVCKPVLFCCYETMGNTKPKNKKQTYFHFLEYKVSMVSSWSCSPKVIIWVTEISTLPLFQAFKGYVPRKVVHWWKVNEIETKEYFLK
jgi:hypothetical protein